LQTVLLYWHWKPNSNLKHHKFRNCDRIYYYLLSFMHLLMKIDRMIFFALMLVLLASSPLLAQPPGSKDKQSVRTVTVPISIFTKKELQQDQTEEFVRVDRLVVREDKDEQAILSVRSVMNTPLALAVLIQDELSPEINLQLNDLRNFIKALPRGSRVMVASIRGGSLRIRQRFTDNLEKAAAAIQIIGGTSASNGPYDGVSEATNYFEALPGGRRAILLISDGVDATRGTAQLDVASPPELERAALKAQRRSVAVYSIYSPTSITQNGNSSLATLGQSGLAKLSDETGGRAFYLGTVAPVSFVPFLKDLTILLGRQFALTYLSTHMKRGYHRVEIESTNPDVRIEHPKGYYYR
jgi:VWFA-related protein